jgi:carboxymethylenebutenolidase
MKRILFTMMIVFAALNVFAQKSSCCAMPATTQFAMLSKDRSFTSSHDEPRPFVYESKAGKMITYKTPDGKQASAFELKAAKPTNNYLLVIHEWWGLNDYIKQEAEKFYNDLGNVNVIALDLYDGKVATKREEAAKYMQQVNNERAEAIIKGAINHAGKKAEVATIGWCFGGGWSLQAALLAGKQASGCIMYYGMPEKSVEKLKNLNTDVLGLFAGKEEWISPAVVAEFEKNMQQAGKKLQVKIFDAEHAFANPSNPHFDKQATAEAYKIATSYLKERLN